jgi:hypothetical protein
VTAGEDHDRSDERPAAGAPQPAESDAKAGEHPLALPGPSSRRPGEDSGRQAAPGPAGTSDGSAAEADEEPREYALPDDTVKAYFGGSGRANFIDEMNAQGTVIFGDGATTTTNFNYGKQDQVRARVAPVPRIRARVDTYARVACYDKLRRLLDERRVVCLTGPPGTGRFTTACAVLADRHHDPDRVVEIIPPPTGDVHEALCRPDLPKPGQGHVIRLPDDQEWTTAVRGGIAGPTLVRTLQASFAKCDATGVLIATAGLHDRESHRAEVAHGRPDPSEVFRKHMWFQLAGRCVGACGDCHSHCKTAYLTECLAMDVLRKALAATYRPSEVVDIATAFAERVPRGPAIDEVLDGCQPARRTRATQVLLPDRAGELLGRQRDDQYQRAFRISYAAFDREPLANVFDAAGMLLDEIDAEAGLEARGRPALDYSVKELLGPHLSKDWDDGRAAVSVSRPGTAQLAWLRDRRMAQAIIDVAWHDFDNTRPALFRWLDRLVRDDREDVRRVAGVIAGALTHHDFVQVHDTLLDKWARSPRSWERQCAAWAAYLAAKGGQVTERVAAKVREWAHGAFAYPHDTAARLYAAGFRQRFLEWTLGDLRAIARDPMQRRRWVVANAVDDMYSPRLAESLLAVLAEWARARPPVRTHAARTTLLLARRVTAQDLSQRPELLSRVGVGAGQASIDDLTSLWQAALLDPATTVEAWPVLGQWVAYADPADDIETCADLLERLAKSPAIRRRMRYYLPRAWQRHRNGEPFPPRLGHLLEGDLS